MGKDEIRGPRDVGHTMANGRSQMADRKWQIARGKCRWQTLSFVIGPASVIRDEEESHEEASLLHLDAVEAGIAAAAVAKFQVGSGAGVSGHRNPVRSEEVGAAFDDVTLAGDAGPAND